MNRRARERDILGALFQAAVQAADPLHTLRGHLPSAPRGRTVVVGAGKAAARMAEAFEALWEGACSGVVVDRHGTTARLEHLRLMTAAHPVPDAAGILAAQALLGAVAGLSEDDLVVALISGGGSALLPCPAHGLTLADEAAVNRALMASGAPIAEMNVVRSRISRIKGGRLAGAAHPARVVSLIVSDIPGDDPSLVASGPTVPLAAAPQAALDIIQRYRISLPAAVLDQLMSAEALPRANDPAFARDKVQVIASARLSLMAAARAAEAMGLEAIVLSDAIEGEAATVGSNHARLAREMLAERGGAPRPLVLLSGGETTVTLGQGPVGKGGRNTEYLLALAKGLHGVAGVHALAADTDGIDGSEDNAGAFADGTSWRRMDAAGISADAALARHDAWSAFKAVNDLFVTGATGTNVNDFRAILLWPPGQGADAAH